MEIDSRRIRRLIRHHHARERRLDRVIREQAWLDRFAEPIQKAVGALYDGLGEPGRTLRSLMHGTKVLGHPLHPALTDIPVGAWTVAVLADWLWVATGRVPAIAGDLALAAGLAAAVLAALTGFTDFHDTAGHERRTALVHGMTMSAVVALDFISLGLRVGAPGLRVTAILLSTVAWLVLVFGSYVGGHLTFGIGSAVNHNAFFDGPMDFVRVGKRDDFPEGEMRRVEANGLPVVIVRPFLTYGPRQEATKLIPYTIRKLLRGESPQLSSANRLCDFIHLSDVIRGMLWAAMQPGIVGETFDLGTGEVVSIRAAVEMVARLIGANVPVQFAPCPERAHEPPLIADLDTSRRLLGWTPRWTLESGLRATIDWYSQQELQRAA